MLTKSHYAARQYVCAHDRATYRWHMCGLCHALGDDYGLTTRLLTNHDMILLNLLTEAQYPQETPTVMRRCPLNPRRKVPTNQEAASRFAAATAPASPWSASAIAFASHLRASSMRSCGLP